MEQINDPEPERYYDWMLWKMRQEDAKMAPLKKTSSMLWVTFRKEPWERPHNSVRCCRHLMPGTWHLVV